MLLFKVHSGLDVGSVYIGGECGEVQPTLLKHNCLGHDQCSCQKGYIWQGKKICGFSDVEGQKWVSSGDCKIRRTAHTSADCNMISPHDGCGSLVPLGLITIANLEQCLAHIKVCSFCNPICTGIITKNVDVSNMVTLGEVVKSFHECGAIVCDDFTKHAPSAKDVFKDEARSAA